MGVGVCLAAGPGWMQSYLSELPPIALSMQGKAALDPDAHSEP